MALAACEAAAANATVRVAAKATPLISLCRLRRRFANHDANCLLLAIIRFVAKIKNACREPKPFGTIIERPDAGGIGQYVHEPADQIIDAAVIFRRRVCLSVCGFLPALQSACVHEIGLVQLTVR